MGGTWRSRARMNAAVPVAHRGTFGRSRQSVWRISAVLVSLALAFTTAIATAAPASAVGPPVATWLPSLNDVSGCNYSTGDEIDTDDGVWDLSGATILSTTYAWERSSDGTNWATIPGAISTSYYPVAADIGFSIRSVVTVTTQFGTTSARSAAGGPVASGLIGPPQSVYATPGNGTLTAHWSQPTSWNGGSFGHYELFYRADGNPTWSFVNYLTNGQQSSYVISNLSNGTAYWVKLIAVDDNSGCGGQPGISPTTATPTAPPTVPSNTAAPTITGGAGVGGTLTASQGNWNTGGATITAYSYQWQHSPDGSTWTAITGANSASYTPISSDLGRYVRVLVGATNTAGTATAVASPATAAVLSGIAATPTGLSSTASNSQLTLSWAAPTALNGGVISDYTVQYRPSGSSSWATWTHAASTSPSATVTGLSNGTAYDWEVAAVTGAGTGAFANYSSDINSEPYTLASNTAAPTITGSALVGIPLTASFGTWNGNGRTVSAYTYQWQNSPDGSTWTAITGATSASYTPSNSDLGRYVRVLVGATNTAGTATAVASPATAATSTPPGSSSAGSSSAGSSSAGFPPVGFTMSNGLTLGEEAAGSTVTFTGTALAPGTNWALELHSTPTTLGQGVTSSSGTFNVTAQLPNTIDPGQHRIIVRATAANGTAWQSVLYFTVGNNGTISYMSTVHAEYTLASSGTDPNTTWLAALSLLLLGAILLAKTTRARRHTPEPPKTA